MTEGLGRALARPTQPVHRPWSPSGHRRGSEVPVPRPRAWRSAAARLPAAAAGWAKSINPLLRHEVEGVHRLGSRGYQVGPSEPQVTTRGRATYTIRFPLTKSQQNVTGCSSTLTLGLTLSYITLDPAVYLFNYFQFSSVHTSQYALLLAREIRKVCTHPAVFRVQRHTVYLKYALLFSPLYFEAA